MRAKVIIGAGYGDEGKGLMTDYFCSNVDEKSKVLNIRVNGGTQAGHTVCKLDRCTKRYDRWVFRNLGSGSLAFADTFLASRFIVNFYELGNEIKAFNRHFGFTPALYISKNCRIQFRMDAALNRIIEYTRDSKHGTCGFGIFETVNRHHCEYELRVAEAYEYYAMGKDEELVDKILDLSLKYMEDRLKYLRLNEYNNIVRQTGLNIDNKELLENARDYAFKTAEDIKNFFDENRDIYIMELNDLMKTGEYTDFVFECSQGLELNWGDPRNTPHVTASHTGLTNVIKELKTCESIDLLTDIEVCYVTRSYKTKHGDGTFFEKDYCIEEEYTLYDKTNKANRFQGAMKFGLIDHERMFYLIKNDLQLLQDSNIQLDTCNVVKSLAVTHLDQTNEAVLLKDIPNVLFSDFTAREIGGTKTYYSFGEKASDILVIEE